METLVLPDLDFAFKNEFAMMSLHVSSVMETFVLPNFGIKKHVLLFYSPVRVEINFVTWICIILSFSFACRIFDPGYFF